MTEIILLELAINREDRIALTKLRDEQWPRASIEAVALKCMRDELVRCGLRKSSARNRSRGARRAAA